MSKILVNYIYIGSNKRLEKLKFFKPFSFENITSIGFDKETELVELIDKVIADSSSNLVVLLPPGSSPNKSSRESLKKMALINQLSWGWFKLNNNKVLNKLKGIILSMNQIPTLEQGIFFSRDLYFSIGGIGKVMKSPFDEIGKRLYSRIDPQKPLPPLIIRSKKIGLS